MDLAWVLLIRIRQGLGLCFCFRVLVLSHCFSARHTLHVFFVLLFFLHCFPLFFFVFHSLFFLRGDEDVAIWRGVHVIG